jgi:hypothetical protein
VVDLVRTDDVIIDDVSSGANPWDPSAAPAFADDAALVAPLLRALPNPPGSGRGGVSEAQWAGWLRPWLAALADHQQQQPSALLPPVGGVGAGAAAAAVRLRLANPKVDTRGVS